MNQMNALIIDDDKPTTIIIAHLLHRMGVTSTEVSDPRQLESFLRDSSDTFDIVFLDLHMPYINGYTILKTLRDSPVTATVPVVASSVHTAEIREAQQAGFHSFISKPFSRDTFPAYVERILNGENIWEA